MDMPTAIGQIMPTNPNFSTGSEDGNDHRKPLGNNDQPCFQSNKSNLPLVPTEISTPSWRISPRRRPFVYVGMAADLLHHGHMNIIDVATNLGDVVVGVLT